MGNEAATLLRWMAYLLVFVVWGACQVPSPPQTAGTGTSKPNKSRRDSTPVSRRECQFGELQIGLEETPIQALVSQPALYMGQRVRVRGYVILAYDLEGILSTDRQSAIHASWERGRVGRNCVGPVVAAEGVIRDAPHSRWKYYLQIEAMAEK